jgi:very-short-patch-repair endonuclease
VPRSRCLAERSTKPAPSPGFVATSFSPTQWGDVTRVAARQDGVVATRQLLEIGLTEDAIAHRVRTGLLRRVHRSVYLCGAVPGPWWEEWAAVLTCGARSVLSHASAPALYGVRERPAIVHITRPSASGRRRGMLIHRGDVDDVRVVHGLPVTSPQRTMQDLAGSLGEGELARLLEEMRLHGLIDAVEVAPHRAGAPKLRAVLARGEEPRLTRSEAERRLLRLIRAARLPVPATTARVGRFEVDALWERERLIVEVDGFAFHGSRPAFERDRRRDAELLTLGYRVLRVTWRQLVDEPEADVAQIAAPISAARCA